MIALAVLGVVLIGLAVFFIAVALSGPYSSSDGDRS